MKVEEKLFILGTESGNKINETDNLLVVINGNVTGLHLRKLFESYKQGTSEIRGNSFLGEYKIVDNQIQVAEDLLISAINKNDDQLIYFTKIKEPFIQMSAMRTPDQDMWIAKLREELAKVVPEDELTKEDIIEEEIHEAIQEEVKEILETGEPEAEEEHEEEEQEQEEDVFAPLKEKGYTQYSDKDYHLLYNKETRKGGLFKSSGEKVPYTKVSDENDIKVLKVENEAEDLVFNVG